MINCYCDGSALAYANVGGWAFYRDDGVSRSAAVWHHGSNQMELWACIEALASFPTPTDVTVHTDSQYVLGGVSKRKEHGGRLWDELYLWMDVHESVLFKKVKSHPNHTKAHHAAREAVFSAVRKTPPRFERRRKRQIKDWSPDYDVTELAKSSRRYPGG